MRMITDYFTCYTSRHKTCDVAINKGPDGDLGDISSAVGSHRYKCPDVHTDCSDATEATTCVRGDNRGAVLKIIAKVNEKGENWQTGRRQMRNSTARNNRDECMSSAATPLPPKKSHSLLEPPKCLIARTFAVRLVKA